MGKNNAFLFGVLVGVILTILVLLLALASIKPKPDKDLLVLSTSYQLCQTESPTIEPL